MTKISIESYAKINVGLYIKGKRADGFHDLQSFFQEISLSDTITIEKRNDKALKLSSNWDDIPLDERNTVYKAAALLNLPNGVNIHLKKRIPHEAGLGGGSSNAAYTMLALNDLFNLNLNKSELAIFGAKIGSDVPFFIHGGQADVQGRGEIIKPINLDFNYEIVLVKPHAVSYSTADIYKNYQAFLEDSKNDTALDKFYKIPNLDNLKKLRNDLEKSIPKESKIFSIKEKLQQSGAVYTAMTGSGSVVFALYNSPITELDFPNCDIYHCESRSAK